MTERLASASVPSEPRPLTIGAVCRRLREEFPDISISKIRYLEEQGLVSPQRTQGGYRLFGEDDVDRLRTILRLQRDEFLPLRVIRDELTVPGRARSDRSSRVGGIRAELEAPLLSLDELCERAGVDPAFARELADFGLIREEEGGFPEGDADIAATCEQLSRYGVEPRNLRAFRTGIDREVALLGAIVAPALRSRNPERRQGGLDELESLSLLSLELSRLLFRRALRDLAMP